MPILPGRALTVVVLLVQSPHIGQKRAENIVQRGHPRLPDLQQMHGDMDYHSRLRQFQAAALGYLVADLPVPVQGMIVHNRVFVHVCLAHPALIYLLIGLVCGLHVQQIIS